MRLSIVAMAALGTSLVLAAPASAQMVNGLSGPNYMHDAPIGTKAGGALSTLNVPGEKEAIAGAIRNEMDAKAMQRTTEPLAVKTSLKASLTTKHALRKQTARNDAKLRLDMNSD